MNGWAHLAQPNSSETSEVFFSFIAAGASHSKYFKSLYKKSKNKSNLATAHFCCLNSDPCLKENRQAKLCQQQPSRYTTLHNTK